MNELNTMGVQGCYSLYCIAKHTGLIKIIDNGLQLAYRLGYIKMCASIKIVLTDHVE